MDTFNELQEMLSRLDVMLKTLKQRGNAFANAEHDYQIAKRVAILKLMDEGGKVTLVQQIARGIPSVAKLRLQRDIAETEYKSIQEAINVYKLKCRLWESQLEREWSHAGKV